MNILILEDNAHVSDRLKNLIEKNVNNAEVFLCSNVDEAWLKINKYRIDLFLLDIILDGKNKNDSSGILFAQSVREIAKYKMTPIIFVTSLIGWEADLLKTIHCYDYIEKPLGDGKIAISKILNAIEAIQSRPIPKRVEYIPLHYDGIGYMLAVKDIICIENKKGVLYVYLKDEKIEILRISLKKVLELVDEDTFLIPMHGIAINPVFISKINFSEKEIFMHKMCHSIRIGERKMKKFKEDYKRWRG